MIKSAYLALTAVVMMNTGCAVVTVADAAVSIAATAVKTTVKVGAAAVDAVIPDSDDGKKEKEKE